jgi:hypothetical protein
MGVGMSAEEPPSSGVLGDSPLQSRVLEDVRAAVRYHRWLTGLALPALGAHPVELGSGLGDYAQTWLDAGVPRITVSERDPERLAHLRRRFGSSERVEVSDFDVYDPPTGRHTSFVAFNVLEHLADDVGALRAAHRLVIPGGAVVMFVPAFQFAMSRFDRAVGHVRRYTKQSLRTAFWEAGLSVERLHYVNAPGLLAWVVGMRLLRLTPGEGPVLLRLWDGTVIPAAAAVESRWSPPFGQSVFAVGRVPE